MIWARSNLCLREWLSKWPTSLLGSSIWKGQHEKSLAVLRETIDESKKYDRGKCTNCLREVVISTLCLGILWLEWIRVKEYNNHQGCSCCGLDLCLHSKLIWMHQHLRDRLHKECLWEPVAAGPQGGLAFGASTGNNSRSQSMTRFTKWAFGCEN